MEAPPRDQTSLGERWGRIGRRVKGLTAVLSYHWFITSQMVSGKMLLTAICKASSTSYYWDDRQRRKVYGERFHKRMINLQRVDIETCFGASSLSHQDWIRSQEVKLNDYNKALSGRQPLLGNFIQFRLDCYWFLFFILMKVKKKWTVMNSNDWNILILESPSLIQPTIPLTISSSRLHLKSENSRLPNNLLTDKIIGKSTWSPDFSFWAL